MGQPDINSTIVSQGEAPPPAEGSTKVCLISLAGEFFALHLGDVRELFEVDSITRVAGMPPALVGVANLRGVIVPVVDLRLMIGLSTSGPKPGFAVVIRHGVQQAAVLAEQMPEIRIVQKEQFLPAPAEGSNGQQPFVTAVLRLGERLGGVIEVPKLLAYIEGGR